MNLIEIAADVIFKSAVTLSGLSMDQDGAVVIEAMVMRRKEASISNPNAIFTIFGGGGGINPCKSGVGSNAECGRAGGE